MRNRVGLALTTLLCLAGPGQSDAQEATSLPAVKIMPCTTKCASSTPAEVINKGTPGYTYPSVNIGREALVLFRYTVKTDGTVGDIDLLQLVGPADLADSARRNLGTWTFKPATMNGGAVEQSRTILFKFAMKTVDYGSSKEFLESYSKAGQLLQNGHLAEGESVLEQMKARGAINLYEAGMLGYLLSAVAAQKMDDLSVLEYSEIPLYFVRDRLSNPILIPLVTLRINAALALGNVAEASATLDAFRTAGVISARDPLVKIVADSKTRLDAVEAFSLRARIPQSGLMLSPVLLSRRHFGFQNISAPLGKFTLSCDQHTIESIPSEKAEWHIPADWSNCVLYVRGVPGTTFDVVQANQ